MEENNVNTLPHIGEKIPAKLYMRMILGYDVPISGGWGYSLEDAVVIKTDNSMAGVAFEYLFIKQRTMLEVAGMGDEYYLENLESVRQELLFKRNVPYDVITCKATVARSDDESKVVHTVKCWFNVKKFFGKH